MKKCHFRVARSRHLLRMALIAAAAAGAILTVGGPVQAATATTAHPAKVSSSRALASATNADATYTRCGYGSSSGNTYTCVAVTRSGAYLDSVKASAKIINAARTIQVCTHAPWGTMGCTAFYKVYPGATLRITSYQNSYVEAGNYCANTWRYNSNGTHTEIGHECEYIP